MWSKSADIATTGTHLLYECLASYQGLPIFFNACEKNREGLVDLVPLSLQPVVEMVADTTSLHHHIHRVFQIFLVCIEKRGKAWVQGYECQHSFSWGQLFISLLALIKS